MNIDGHPNGIGAVQLDGAEQVIACVIRSLTKTERQYFVRRKEMLAPSLFVTHFSHYRLGATFFCRTDYSALQ